MFLSRPKLPVTPEQRAWIEESFALLEGLFGLEWVRNAPLVLPSEKFFPKQWEATEEWARHAFDCVCELMRVPQDRVQLEFMGDAWKDLLDMGVPLGRTQGAAGLYRELEVDDGPPRASISIKDSLFQQPGVMVAVMAHELAHVHLLGDKKIPRDLDKMEPLTDLMAVFSGFGVLSANSAFVRSQSEGYSMQASHGYLSQREYGYSLALFAWARGEQNPAWLKELTTNVRVFTRDTLSCFKAERQLG